MTAMRFVDTSVLLYAVSTSSDEARKAKIRTRDDARQKNGKARIQNRGSEALVPVPSWPRGTGIGHGVVGCPIAEAAQLPLRRAHQDNTLRQGKPGNETTETREHS